MNKELPLWVELVSSWANGVGFILSASPFELVKVRLQTNNDPHHPKYKGMGDCFRRTLKEEGIMAFYKGAALPFLFSGVFCSIQFTSNQFFRRKFNVLQISTFLTYLGTWLGSCRIDIEFTSIGSRLWISGMLRREPR